MSSLKERILEALRSHPMSKTELAALFGIRLAPLDEPISVEEDKLGRTLSQLQESRYLPVKGKDKRVTQLTRVGPVDTRYDKEKAKKGEDPYINFVK